MMLEIYKSVEGFAPPSSGRCSEKNQQEMKHPKNTQQTYEFNLGKALELKCVTGNKTAACNSCESCALISAITSMRSWFPRLGDHSKRRFVLGLVRRFHSVDLLQYVTHILQPLLYKDFTYARARTNPSLDSDRPTLSSDRALAKRDVDKYISTTWDWFGKSNYWSKSNFTLAVLQLCESHILYNVGIQSKTLLASEEKAAISGEKFHLLYIINIRDQCLKTKWVIESFPRLYLEIRLGLFLLLHPLNAYFPLAPY